MRLKKKFQITTPHHLFGTITQLSQPRLLQYTTASFNFPLYHKTDNSYTSRWSVIIYLLFFEKNVYGPHKGLKRDKTILGAPDLCLLWLKSEVETYKQQETVEDKDKGA
jgi:hypothetical protein